MCYKRKERDTEDVSNFQAKNELLGFVFLLQKPDVRLSRGSIDREDGSLQGPVSSCLSFHQHLDHHFYAVRYPSLLIFLTGITVIHSINNSERSSQDS